MGVRPILRGLPVAIFLSLPLHAIAQGTGEARRKPYAQVNGSVGYDFNERAHLSLTGNDLRNSLPVDKSAGWPNYSSAWYDIYRRQ